MPGVNEHRVLPEGDGVCDTSESSIWIILETVAVDTTVVGDDALLVA